MEGRGRNAGGEAGQLEAEDRGATPGLIHATHVLRSPSGAHLAEVDVLIMPEQEFDRRDDATGSSWSFVERHGGYAFALRLIL